MHTTRRIVAYDALRVFAIVSVVAIHTLMPYRALLPDDAPVHLLDDLLHYAVPLFVFISGIFIWGRPLPAEPGAYRRFLSRRVSVVAVPYLAWSAVYLALLISRSDAPLSLGRIVGLLLTGHTWYHLYFIPMLLTFYLLTPIATRIAVRSPEALVLGAYALRLLAGPALAALARDSLGDLGWSYVTHVVSHLPHMALGAWFVARRSYLPRSPWLFSVLLVGGFAELAATSLGLLTSLPSLLQRLLFADGMAAVVLGLALLAEYFEPQLEHWGTTIVRLSALSFGVYFVHPLVLLGVDALVVRFASPAIWLQVWMPVVTFSVVTATSFVLAAVLAQTPYACRLIGAKHPIRVPRSD